MQKPLSLVLILFLSIFFSSRVFSTSLHITEIKMGPILHFNGQDQDLKHQHWKVSALYLLKHTGKKPPQLQFYQGGKTATVAGAVLGHQFGYDFVRYDMTIAQARFSRAVNYWLPGQKPFIFHVPALGMNHRILYHSCNGYQREKDRKKVGGIQPMWRDINESHRASPYHLQLGGGDQLYADGLVNKPSSACIEPTSGDSHGVFACETLKPWIKDTKHLGIAKFTEEMAEEIKQFYFDHYVRHYTSEEFSLAMATIPSIVQLDDHDFFDGCGSYPVLLQDGPVMSSIRNIGMWFGFAVQHQLYPQNFVASSQLPARPYNFLHVINDGKIAIYGVDTRTERTEFQVVSKRSWKKIFKQLDALPESVKHLIFMVGIPVVYAKSAGLDNAFTTAESNPVSSNVLPMIPGVKKVFQKNAFKLFELADDLRDGWNHPFHQKERNEMVARLQKLATKKELRVTIISGDVHLGGAGVIVQGKDYNLDDNKTIVQIISSPVGNVTPSKRAAHYIGNSACSWQEVGKHSRMCLVKLKKSHELDEKANTLIAHRNVVTLMLSPTNELHAEWSVERRNRNQPHKRYYYTIPAPKH